MDELPKPDRRSFLKGRAALDAILPLSDSPDLESHSNSDRDQLNRQSNYLEQYSKNAMACEFELLFNMHQYQQSGVAAMEACQLIDDLEDQLTIYRDHSEISQINRNAVQHDVRVEPRLFELLKLATEIYEQTGRAFDITSGPLSSIWGFDRRVGVLPDEILIDEALKTVGTQWLKLDDADGSIRFLKHGLSINLGGIGKGHALDRAAELIEAKGVEDFVIHGGQSSVLSRGSSVISDDHDAVVSSADAGGKAPDPSINTETGWSIGLSHPTLPAVRLAEVVLRNQALGTSGTGRQGFYHQGKRYGHIIDPRTGWPASHFLSTTVISPSAALSDALATAFFVMSLEEVAAYCESRPSVSAICVTHDPAAKARVRLHAFNLSDDNWTKLV
jgi:thiamine biosynthesis lipoprotein